ncbi:uncharacterized protein LOC132950711 isoform X2 [Metopolophium dirhodum]|uniref:uncharacterized protein LOC132950711 isoform X2 n=1 Tax=Metopolophium dirhodum TaxID=44670 RepID=UPI0029907372|nr:uncharacterized protein LOC132950711 isoform X2 [Metopolophium dirhodum]
MLIAAAVEFAMVSVCMFASSAGVAIAVVAVIAYTVYGRLNRHKLLCIQQRDILNTKLKAKVASKAENDHKFFEVRDYLERLVEGLVDGGLDDVCLTPLSTHPLYMSICWKYHEQLATTLTAAIHSIINESDEFDDIPIKLNTILKEVSYDVEHLPELQAAQKKCAVPLAEDLNEKNYEDLLATAILNKIVANSQTKKKVPVARTRISKFPPKQTDSNIQNSKKTEEPRKTPRVSLTVEEFTEEVTTTSYNTYSDIEGDYDDGYNEGDEEDDERSQSTIGMFMSNAKLLRGHTAPLPEFGSDAVEDGSSTIDPDDQGISATVDSWEDNWLFQKKRVNRMSGSNNYHHHPVPVPMLVPNPSEVTRPLIGDRDADETSELSDYSNSALDELLELSDFESEPLQTKRSDVDTNSANGGILLFEGPSSEEDNPLIWDPVVEACNKHVALSQVDSGQGSMDHQRDFDQSIEVNEKPVPRPRSSLMSSATDSSEVNSVSSEDVNVAQEDEQLPPRPGTIAEREHSKWEKATPLTNNPYSAENIEKRKYKTLFGSRSSSEASLNLINGNDTSSPLKIVCSPSLPDTQRYGRDYYINQSGELKTRQKQTKVSKLVVQIGEDELEGDGRRTDGVLQDSTPVTPQSTSSGDSLAPFGTGGGQDKLVRVCSWTDRRDSGSGVPKSSIAESADDVHHCMPSVRELAKQFSSHNAENTCKNPSRQVHSLTARSLSREYREGLGLKVRDKSGHAVQDSDDSGNGSAKSEDANTVSHRHLLQLA